MAFTEAQLQAQLAADGSGCVITRFIAVGTTHTDVYAQNMNATSSEKTGGTQIAQTNTAAQAAAILRAMCSA